MSADSISVVDGDHVKPPATGLFRGARSIRWRGEKAALRVCILLAPITVGFITFVLHEQVAGSSVAVIIVGALAYTAMARGKLLGTSVRVHQSQLPRLFGIVQSCAGSLGVTLPHIFVREDLQVPLVAVGFQEPYSLVVSTNWLPHLQDDELTFLIARELGHIYAQHTRLSSLLSSSGADNPLLALVMGPWLRRTEYTADRVGLLCCGDIDASIRAIIRTDFRPIAELIDVDAFAAQREEIEADSSLRAGEWISREPYATNRIYELKKFAATPLFAFWRNQLMAWSTVEGRPTFRERRPRPLALAVVIDVVLVASFWNYLYSGHEVVVTLDTRDAQGIVRWLDLHAPILRSVIKQNASVADLTDAARWLLSLALALALYLIITIVMRRTPGVFIVGSSWSKSEHKASKQCG